MKEHTPGPWTLAEANSTIPIKGANGRTVASVKYGETDLPDALLIAAAPDMLAALQAALSWARLNTQRAGTLDVERMYAAIARATDV